MLLGFRGTRVFSNLEFSIMRLHLFLVPVHGIIISLIVGWIYEVLRLKYLLLVALVAYLEVIGQQLILFMLQLRQHLLVAVNLGDRVVGDVYNGIPIVNRKGALLR